MATGIVTSLDRRDGKNGPYAKITVDSKEMVATKWAYDKLTSVNVGDTIEYEAKPSASGDAIFINNPKKVSSGSVGQADNSARTVELRSAAVTPTITSDRNLRIEMQVMYKIAGESLASESYPSTVDRVGAISFLAKALHMAFLKDVEDPVNPTLAPATK